MQAPVGGIPLTSLVLNFYVLIINIWYSLEMQSSESAHAVLMGKASTLKCIVWFLSGCWRMLGVRDLRYGACERKAHRDSNQGSRMANDLRNKVYHAYGVRAGLLVSQR